jgi:hypothetical protein
MDINELRYANQFRFNSEFVTLESYSISMIGDYGVTSVKLIEHKRNQLLSLLEPILIDESLLLNSGFVLGQNILTKKSYIKNDVSVIKINKWRIYYQNRWIADVKYYHELQNFFYDLTKDRINFKFKH